MTKIIPTSMSITNNCNVVQHVLIVYNRFMILFCMQDSFARARTRPKA